MKRLVHPTSIINAGISVDETGNIRFNWASDDSKDVMSLVSDTSGEFDADNVRFIYGYAFKPRTSSGVKKVVRDYLKGNTDSSVLYGDDLSEFVERAVIRLDERYPLDNFNVTVHVDSSTQPSLVDVMREWLWEHLNNVNIDFELIKELYRHVKFDTQRAIEALRNSGKDDRTIKKEIEFTLGKFNKLKQSGQLFQMKRFVPKEIRAGFFDFLKFKTDEERDAYKALQGVNVLIFDDIMTSGSTVREVIRYLKAINDKNTLTVFVLIKQ